MATYTITDREDVDWNENCQFKYRYRSSDGSPTAQSEFDRRCAAGQFAILWKWEHNQSKQMARCGTPTR